MHSYNEFLKYGIVIPEDKVPNSKGNVYIPCPECAKTRIHREKSKLPVLGVHIVKGCWGCNNCGWTGALERTVKADIRFVEKVKGIKKDTDYEISSEIVQWFWNKRKISIDTLRRNRIFFAVQSLLIKNSNNPKEVGQYIKKNCINYPYYEDGELVTLKYRDGKKNFGATVGGRMTFYGIDDIQMDDWCVIVEGENDKLSFSEAGIQNCISVPNGSQISEEERKRIINGEIFESQMNLEYIDNCHDKLKHIKKFIIATDDDPPGIKLRRELARRLGKSRCCYITFKGKNDPNEFLYDFGPDKLRELLDDVIEFPIEGIVTVRDVYVDLEREYIHGKAKGYSLGWKCLDPHFTLRFGDLLVGNGYPGMGKTTFTYNMVINTAILYDWKWGMYCPENYPERRVFDSLAEILVGNSSDRDFKSRMTLNEYKRALLDFIHKHVYLIRGNKRYSPKDVNDIGGEMISKLGIVGLIKDPWNALKHSMKNRSLDDYLEDALSDETEFATKNEIINLIIAHPPTPPRDKLSTLPCPTYFMIRGGAIWAAKCFGIYALHQRNYGLYDIKDTTVEFHVQKSKDHKSIGRPTPEDNPVLLTFRRASNRFYELSTEGGGKWVNPIEEHKDIFKQQINFDTNE
jgi:twinkle protein